MRCILQDWVLDLTYMQQSVLITATRGPDGLDKNHVSKLLIRWLRRCYLKAAFTGEIIPNPSRPNGGSFTGPSCSGAHDWTYEMDILVSRYLARCDEVPHHFHLHFIHASEILGYKHPDPVIRSWWKKTYLRLTNDMHVLPEPEDIMDNRLSDNEENWRQAEEVTARNPES